MWLFTNSAYNNLNEAVAHANSCKSLTLFYLDYNLADRGADILTLKNLTKLHIKADPKIYYDYDFKLPQQIGELRQLKKLTLLNLPLSEFPDWITELTNLHYLTVRGNDITNVPGTIQRLNKLQTLRIENCPLQALPPELADMNHITHLGLCDTRLVEIKAHMFPKKLKSLDFSGSGCYKPEEIRQLKRDLKSTRVFPDFG